MEIIPDKEEAYLQMVGSKDVSVQLFKLQMLVTSSHSNQCDADSGSLSCLPAYGNDAEGQKKPLCVSLPSSCLLSKLHGASSLTTEL